jgi:hypothetical protein
VPSRTAVSLVGDLGQLHLTSRMLIFANDPSAAVRWLQAFSVSVRCITHPDDHASLMANPPVPE